MNTRKGHHVVVEGPAGKLVNVYISPKAVENFLKIKKDDKEKVSQCINLLNLISAEAAKKGEDCFIIDFKIKGNVIDFEMLVPGSSYTKEKPVYEKRQFSIQNVSKNNPTIARELPPIKDLPDKLNNCVNHLRDSSAYDATEQQKGKERERQQRAVEERKREEKEKKDKVSELEDAKRLFGADANPSPQIVKLKNQLSALSGEHKNKNEEIKKITEAFGERRDQVKDSKYEAMISPVKNKHVEEIKNISSNIEDQLKRIEELISDAHKKEVEGIMVKAKSNLVITRESEYLALCKSFIFEYIKKNSSDSKKMKAIGEAVFKDKILTGDLTTAITRHLLGLPVDQQLIVIGTIQAAMTEFSDFNSGLKERMKQMKPESPIIEKAKAQIATQEGDIEEEIKVLQEKMKLLDKSIEEYRHFVNVDLERLGYIHKLKAKVESEHNDIIRYNDMFVNLTIDNMLRKFEKSTGKDADAIRSSCEKIKEQIEKHERAYEKLLEVLNNVDTSQEQADKAVEEMRKLDAETKSLIQREMAIARCLEKKLSQEVVKLNDEVSGINQLLWEKQQEVLELEGQIEKFNSPTNQASTNPFAEGNNPFDSLLPETPFSIIDAAIEELRKPDNTKSPAQIEKEMQDKLNASKQEAKAALHAESEKAKALPEKVAKAKEECVQRTQKEICAKLKDMLEGQIDYWKENRLSGGVEIMHKGEKVKVPTGLGNMMIALDPSCKPKPKSKFPFFSSKEKTSYGSTSQSVNAKDALVECQRIAVQRLEGKLHSVERREKRKDPGQVSNTRILKMVKDINVKELDDPQKLKELKQLLIQKSSTIRPAAREPTSRRGIIGGFRS